MGSARGGVSWRAQGAAAVFLTATLLGLFPPIPPVVKGSSVWGYLLKSIAIGLVALEAHRQAFGVAAAWGRLEPRARWLAGLGTAAGLTAAALTARALWPDLFVRLSREEGPWETLSTACYLGCLVLLWRLSGSLSDPGTRGHLRLIGACFAMLFLEEVDYAGIIGAVLGRVDGVYVGSLHDVIHLAANGSLPAGAVAALVAGVAAGGALLWRWGWVRPRLVLRTLTSGGAFWLGSGMAFLVAAALGEVGLLGPAFADRSPEEAIEMAGAICLGAFALDTAAEALAGRRASLETWTAGPPRRTRNGRDR